MSTGRLLGIGVGPGDPDLITLKALHYLRAAPVLAYVAANGQPSIARRIVAPHLPDRKREIELTLPMHPRPERAQAAYDEGASRIAAELERGLDVAVLCEGDPLLYGSFIQILARLGERYRSEIIPGVISASAAAAAARVPLVWRDMTLTIIPATLPEPVLAARLREADAAAVLKLGRHLDKLRRILAELGGLRRAIYVEYASWARERIVPFAEMLEPQAPYFSLLLLPPTGEP